MISVAGGILLAAFILWLLGMLYNHDWYQEISAWWVVAAIAFVLSAIVLLALLG